MMPNLRLQILLAAAGIGLIAAFLLVQQRPLPVRSNSPEILRDDNICLTNVPASGGDFVEGIVGAPRYLNPLLNDFIPVDKQITDLIFDGLVTFNPQTRRFEPALAERWEISEDGRTFTFFLRPNILWHDGELFSSQDVAFTYGLLQDDTAPTAVGALWKTISINPIDETTIQFSLVEPYAPFIEATMRGILPAHLLEGETIESLQNHPFSLAPIGTGPFLVDPTQDWTQSGQLKLLSNPNYVSDSYLDSLTFRFFPDKEELKQAFSRGEISAISSLSDSTLPIIAAETEARIFTNPVNRYSAVIFNQGEGGHGVLKTNQGRYAMAMSLDRDQLIDTALRGQGVLLDGPYLPNSWAFAPKISTSILFNPISATAVLENQGYFLNEGALFRQNEAGILSLRLIGLAQDRELVQAVAQQWIETLGIQIEPTIMASGEDLRRALGSGLFDMALVDISPAFDPDLYDFWSQEAIINGQNYGQWNNWRASEALEAGRQRVGIDARRPFYNTFLRFYQTELPALTLFQHVESYIVSKDVHQVDIGVIFTPRDRYRTFNQWAINQTEVPIPCE